MFFAQHSPPDANGAANGKAPEATFPSGHTTGVTAEALAIAYILSREKLASPEVLAALLAWPLVVGVTRLYRDRHWFSDVLAGWIAGIGVASLSVIFYQARVGRQPSS
jgi:undecaprenyl-diphosphatase